MDTKYASTLIKSWRERREAKGFVVTADDVWERINAKWPRSEEWQRERVFQVAA